MADSELKLPGDFDPSKTYWLKGETLMKWREALIRDRIIAGTGIKETPTPTGRILKASIAQAITAEFYSQIRNEDGHIFLQTGTIAGVGVEQLDLKIFHNDPVSPYWLGTFGQQLYVEANGESEVVDGFLMPGFEVTSLTIEIGTPTGHVYPTLESPTGKAIIPLGTFVEGGFNPSGWGSWNITACFTGFTITRVVPDFALP
jgi:hypothetical protein